MTTFKPHIPLSDLEFLRKRGYRVFFMGEKGKRFYRVCFPSESINMLIRTGRLVSVTHSIHYAGIKLPVV